MVQTRWGEMLSILKGLPITFCYIYFLSELTGKHSPSMSSPEQRPRDSGEFPGEDLNLTLIKGENQDFSFRESVGTVGKST